MSKKYENISDCPECFGKAKEKCDCVYHPSCKLVTESDKQLRTDHFHAQEENIEYDTELGDKYQEDLKDEVIDAIEPPEVTADHVFGYHNKSGQFIKVDLNHLPAGFIELWTLWVIENQRSAIALMKSMFGTCRNVSDVADEIGVSRQAMSFSIAKELGVGKKKVPESKLMQKCTSRERDVYECMVIRKMNGNETAKELKISRITLFRLKRILASKGINIETSKNKKK